MAAGGARLLRLVAVVLVAGIVAFLVCAWTSAGPDDAALNAAIADERVALIKPDGTCILRPADGAATIRVVFHPGARVEPAAYLRRVWRRSSQSRVRWVAGPVAGGSG